MLGALRQLAGVGGAVRSEEPLRSAEAALQRAAEDVWRRHAPGVERVAGRRVGELHTVSYVGGAKKEAGPPIVCLHGYASGSGIFSTSLPLAARRWGATCHAIDAMGCGLSRREASWSRVSRREAEALATQALESWRVAMAYPKIALVGHSVGACLATAYAERYPDRVSSLVLASPAGLAAAGEQRASWLASFLWHQLSPFAFVRAFPEYGRRLVDAYVERRFDDTEWTAIKAPLADYIFHNLSVPHPSLGSVLHALFLHPPARGGPQRGVDPLEPRLRSLDLPLAFVFGDRDWIADEPAFRVADARRDRVPVFFVAHAGHNLMVDNPPAFADALLAALDARTVRPEARTLRVASSRPPYRHRTVFA